MFSSPSGISIEGNHQFNQANGNIIINNNLGDERSLCIRGQGRNRLMPIQDRFREIRQGDIILRNQVYSGVMEMTIKQQVKSTNPFRPRVKVRTVKIHKKAYSVELVEFSNRKFTLYVFEPENNENKETVATIWKQIYEGLSTHPWSPLRTQVFGLGRLDMPAFISHDELANGVVFMKQDVDVVVACYIGYTWASSVKALDEEFSVSLAHSDWNFNLKTLSWQYDIVPASDPLMEQISSSQFFRLPPLWQETRPQLNANDILAWSKQHFDDFLCLVASFASVSHLYPFDLSPFAPHGLLTFGTVIHRRKGIVAHFPSLPFPERSLVNLYRNVHGCYSEKVPHRIDFDFHRPGYFAGLFLSHLPAQVVAAYLSQSTAFVHSPEDLEGDIKFINEIGIMLGGIFNHDPTTQPTPVYLFVLPIPVEHINGVHCVRYPLPDGLFYWSLDSDGKSVIPEEDWEKYGVPKLVTRIVVGQKWNVAHWSFARDYLISRDYNLDGKQYARDYGYPELLIDDPHDVWFQAESFSLVELFGEDEPDSKVLIKEQLNAEPNLPICEGPNEASNEEATDTHSRPLTRAELVEAEPVRVHNQASEPERERTEARRPQQSSFSLVEATREAWLQVP
ncbi:hypothetical protein PM082_016559 [Marasmius tenuissimus]|nr:hypothetical protein PM082_016559 [Marasmius tenuissimus]